MNRQRRKSLDHIQNLLQQHGLSEVEHKLFEIRDELSAVRDAEEEAYDNLPESLRDDDKAYPLEQLNEALEKIEALLEAIENSGLDEAFEAIENAKGLKEEDR